MNYQETLHVFRQFFGADLIISVEHPDRGLMVVWASTDEKLIKYLKWRNAQGENIYFRPEPSNEQCYLMVDHDSGIKTVHRYHRYSDGKWKPGRCIIESSPNRFQVWIRSDVPISLADKKYWLRSMKADPGAGPVLRNGRLPGYTNRKSVHRRSDGTYPYAKLHWIDLDNIAHVPPAMITQIPAESAAGCKIVRPNPNESSGFFLPRKGESVLSIQKINRDSYAGAGESETDIRYAMALVRHGYDDNDIVELIKGQRENWDHHKGMRRQQDYLIRTVRKARLFVKQSD